jgi:hypothetical protein
MHGLALRGAAHRHHHHAARRCHDLVAMLLARKILVGVTMIVLQVLGAVLGVLQAGLAIEFIK